jgi:23S rRNA (adenine2503-C2)-methyltransferase
MIFKFAKKHNLKKYQIDQFNTGYYKTLISSFDELSTWSKELREELKKEIPFAKLLFQESEESSDGKTIKVLFKTVNGNPVESVLIKEKDRNTVCVSCMSGCPVGCVFCATGQMGVNEMLDCQQILDQILYFARELKNRNDSITNIVYMGMGEPMLNLENVSCSIQAITNKEKLAIGRRRVTLSTSGHVQNLEAFLNMNMGVKIAISLHAPTQELRDTLMPNISKNNRLTSLFRVLDKYVERTNKRITYEYVMLNGVNDSEIHAKELVTILKGRLALVNLINYNENECLPFSKSENVHRFQDILLKNGITCTVRKSYGEEIKGACGQLAVTHTPLIHSTTSSLQH